MKYSKEQKLRSIHLYDVWERNDGEQFTVVYINSKSSSPFLIENFKTRRTFSCTSNIITNNFKLIYIEMESELNNTGQLILEI